MMVLAVVLGVLAVLLALPVGVIAAYDQSGGALTGYIGPVQVKLYPREQKEPRRKKTGKDAKQDAAKQSKTGLGGSFSFFKELLAVGLEALGCFRRRLLLKELTLHLTIGAKDKEPAQWGMLYGGAWAGIGNLIPLLERVFRIEDRDIQVFLDENAGETSIYGRGQFRLLVGEILYLLLHYGLRGLKIYKKQKGSNEHGTSHQ